MLTGLQLDRIIAGSTTKSRISNGYNKMYGNADFIKKFKLEAGSSQTLLIPLSLTLPFNPMDVHDDTYTSRNPFVFNTSVETAWEALKDICGTNREVKEYLDNLLGVTLTEEHWNMRGHDLAVLLKDYRKVDPKGDYTVKVNIPAISQYETRYAIPSAVNSDGVVTFDGLLYQLSCLEQEIIKPEMKALNEKFKEGGELANLSKKARSLERQKIAAKACISRPSLYSVIRVLQFDTANDEPTREVINLANSSDFKVFERWTGCNKDKIDAYMAKLGGKYDCNPSYVEYKVQAGQDEPMLRYANANKSVAEADQLKRYIEGFEQKYQEYRNDIEHQSDNVLMKSIRDLQYLDDSVLMEAYQSNLLKYDKSVFREEVVDKYLDTIRAVNEEFAEQLERDSVRGRLSNETIADDDVMNLIGAETPVYENPDNSEFEAVSEIDFGK